MEITSFLSGQSLPEMVFARPFKHYCFSGFNEIFANQLPDFLNVCYAYFAKHGELKHRIGELVDNDHLLHTKEFTTEAADKCCSSRKQIFDVL